MNFAVNPLAMGSMDGTDPESEALIWKLHRELNGLTRSTRRGQPEPLGGGPARKDSKIPLPKSKLRSTTTSSQQEDNHESQKRKSRSDADVSAPPGQRVRPEEPQDLTHLKPTSCSKPPHGQPAAPPPSLGRQEDPLAPPSRGLPREGTDNPDGPPTQRDEVLPASSPEAKSPHQCLVAAATAACNVAKQRAKQLSIGTGAQRTVKVFYAGIRWGITLPWESLKSRADLALALHVAFAGEIVSCGRGDRLAIVFVDGEGNATELPPRASRAVKETPAHWSKLMERAVKLYVCSP